MRALVKAGRRVSLETLPVPEPGPRDVLVRVRAAGLCRTDLLVMQGLLPARDPLIPGHEFAGEVVAVGEQVKGWLPGEPVSAHPMLGCGACAACERSKPEHCPQLRILGIAAHGAFAEYLCLPAQALQRLPHGPDWILGAYSEPVASAFGVLGTGIQQAQKGFVQGHNRIARLTTRILQGQGYAALNGTLAPAAEQSFDYVVETGLQKNDLPTLIRALKPGGTLIAKSRHLGDLALPWSEIVRKDIRIQGCYYGDFAAAIEWIAANPEQLSDLIGSRSGLDDWQAFIAPDQESGKRFLVMD